MWLVPLAMPSVGTPAAPGGDAHPSEECCETQPLLPVRAHRKENRHSKPVRPCGDGVAIQAAPVAGWAHGWQQSMWTPAQVPRGFPPHRDLPALLCGLQRAALGSCRLTGQLGEEMRTLLCFSELQHGSLVKY